jgi:hypothetical protein
MVSLLSALPFAGRLNSPFYPQEMNLEGIAVLITGG